MLEPGRSHASHARATLRWNLSITCHTRDRLQEGLAMPDHDDTSQKMRQPSALRQLLRRLRYAATTQQAAANSHPQAQIDRGAAKLTRIRAVRSGRQSRRLPHKAIAFGRLMRFALVTTGSTLDEVFRSSAVTR